MKTRALLISFMIGTLLLGLGNFSGSSSDLPLKVLEVESSSFVFAFTNGTRVLADINEVSTIFANEANNTIRAFGIKVNNDTMAIHFNGGNGEYLYAPSFINGTEQSIGTPYFAVWPHYYFNVTGSGWSDFILSATWFQNQAFNPTNRMHVFNQSGELSFYYTANGTVQNSNVWFENGLKINVSEPNPTFATISEFNVDDTPAAYTINNVGFGYELAKADFNFDSKYKFERFSIGSWNGTFFFYSNGSIADGNPQIVDNIGSLPYRPHDYYMGIMNNLTLITPSAEYYNFEFSDVIDAGFNTKYFEIHRENLSATQQNNITILVGAYNLTSYVNNQTIRIDPKLSSKSIDSIPTFDFGDSPIVQSSWSVYESDDPVDDTTSIIPTTTTTTEDIIETATPTSSTTTVNGSSLSLLYIIIVIPILVKRRK